MKETLKYFPFLIFLIACHNDNQKNISGNLLDEEAATQISLEDSLPVISWFNPASLDTTIIFDEVTVTLKVTDSIPIESYFLSNKIIDSIASVYSIFHDRAFVIESLTMPEFDEYVYKDSIVFVKLSDGSWKKLVADEFLDSSDPTFEYFFEEAGYYSLRVQWSEGNGYLLVNYVTGEETSIFGRPYFSKNSEYVISVNEDIIANYSMNGFQLFRSDKGYLYLLAEFNPKVWGPEAAIWIDQNTVILKCKTVQEKGYDSWDLNFYCELSFSING